MRKHLGVKRNRDIPWNEVLRKLMKDAGWM